MKSVLTRTDALVTKIASHPVRSRLVLCLLPALVYAVSLTFPFTPLDEQWLIVHDAPRLNCAGFLAEAFTISIQNIYFRPVFLISLFADFQFSGISPVSYHVSNIIFHVFAVLLLFSCLIQSGAAKMRALIIAALFAVWPLHLNAVAWVPGRNDSLLCVFALLSIYALVRSLREKRGAMLVMHALCFFLALLTKETAVVLPLVFCAVLFADKAGWVAVIAVLSWVAALFVFTWMFRAVIPDMPWKMSLSPDTLQRFAVALIEGSGKMIFPFRQSVMPSAGLYPLYIAIPVVLVAAFLIVRMLPVRKELILPGLTLFLCTISLPLWYASHSTLGEQHEHRFYTPLAGIALLLGVLKNPFPVLFGVRTALTAILIAASVTVFRMQVYATNSAYMEQAIAGSPRNYFLSMRQGNLMADARRWTEAIANYSRAIAIQPGKAHLYMYRAVAYGATDSTHAAAQDFTRAFELFRDQDIEGGMQYMKPQSDEYRGAALIGVLNRLIRQSPGNAELYARRAQVHSKLGNTAAALQDLKKACEMDPDNGEYQKKYRLLSDS